MISSMEAIIAQYRASSNNVVQQQSAQLAIEKATEGSSVSIVDNPPTDGRNVQDIVVQTDNAEPTVCPVAEVNIYYEIFVNQLLL